MKWCIRNQYPEQNGPQCFSPVKTPPTTNCLAFYCWEFNLEQICQIGLAARELILVIKVRFILDKKPLILSAARGAPGSASLQHLSSVMQHCSGNLPFAHRETESVVASSTELPWRWCRNGNKHKDPGWIGRQEKVLNLTTCNLPQDKCEFDLLQTHPNKLSWTSDSPQNLSAVRRVCEQPGEVLSARCDLELRNFEAQQEVKPDNYLRLTIFFRKSRPVASCIILIQSTATG